MRANHAPGARGRVMSLVTAALIALAGTIACGKQGPFAPGTTAGTTFSDGVWYGTFDVSVISGDGGCAATTFVDTFTVVHGLPDTLLVPNSVFVRAGNVIFMQTGRDTLENSPTCVMVQTLEGAGAVVGDSFSATWTMAVAGQGSCVRWPFSSCSLRVTGRGGKAG